MEKQEFMFEKFSKKVLDGIISGENISLEIDQKLLDKYQDKWIEFVGEENIAWTNEVKTWFKRDVEKIFDVTLDKVVVCGSPREYKKLVPESEYRFFGYEITRIVFWEYSTAVKAIQSDSIMSMIELIYSYKILDVYIHGSSLYVIQKPVIRIDENCLLHHPEKMAIEFPDGYGEYYYHNIKMRPKFYENREGVTREDLLAITNSEEMRAVAEFIGWDKFIGLMDTYTVDTWSQVVPERTYSYFEHRHDLDCQWYLANRSEKNDESNASSPCPASHWVEVSESRPMEVLHYELLDFKVRKFDRMSRFLKMESPEIHDGTRPVYIEPVDFRLNTCKAARKAQTLKPDGSTWTIEECNTDPELEYEWES